MDEARAYAYRGHRRVEGWLTDTSARVILELGRWQAQQGISGGVGEIGVHHGRLFLLLDLLRREHERAFAIDIFGEQHLNVDGSGLGDKEVFLDNVRRVVGGIDHLTVIERSSTEVTAEEITEAVGPVRLFSVDGGHTAEITLSDLRLAERSLAPDGLVVLDDVFNESWPGVLTGFSRHLADPDAELVPFAISPNKVLLTNRDVADDYRAVLRSVRLHGMVTEDELFGHRVAIVAPFRRGGMGMLTRRYRQVSSRPVVGPAVTRLRGRFSSD